MTFRRRRYTGSPGSTVEPRECQTAIAWESMRMAYFNQTKQWEQALHCEMLVRIYDQKIRDAWPVANP